MEEETRWNHCFFSDPVYLKVTDVDPILVSIMVRPPRAAQSQGHSGDDTMSEM